MKKLIVAFALFCFAAQALALPPAMEVDRSFVRAQNHIKNQEYAAAAEAMGDALELIKKHDLGLKAVKGVKFYYIYAEVAKKAGDYIKALEMVNRYLEAAGRSGAHYQKALKLYEAVLSAALLGIRNQTTVSQVKALIDAGADVNAKDEDGYTPLSKGAFYNENPEVARLLIEKGADVNAKTKSDWTPLHWAVYNKNPEVVRLLIEKGADVNAKDDDGDTPQRGLISNRKMSSADKEKVKRWLENPGLLRR